MGTPWGALPGGWDAWADVGLTADLLPVVSNQDAEISPGSTMRQTGKTPSVYNNNRCAVGFAGWTQHYTTRGAIDAWSREADYGICVQTRRLRAIDIDIEDAAETSRVFNSVQGFLVSHGVLGRVNHRFRRDSSKILIPVFVDGGIPKAVVKTAHGMVEFLGNGQQFIAEGVHPNGARYEWAEGAPFNFPRLSLEQYRALIDAIQTEFGVEPKREAKNALKGVVPTGEIYDALAAKDLVIEENRNGSHSITCPFEHEHTTESGPTATVYWPAHTGGYAHESIKCLHAHCVDRSMREWRRALGLDGADVFEALPDDGPTSATDGGELDPKFVIIPAFEFAQSGARPEYLIQDFLPCAATGYLFGASGVGKTFAILDIAFAIARGDTWNGLHVKQGNTVYVCAEGAYSFRNRVLAYAKHNDLDLTGQCGVGVIDAAPDLMNAVDVEHLAVALKNYGSTVSHLVLDTMATCIRGDENNSQDIGRMLANIKGLRQYVNPLLTVTLIHHTGKDAAKGARGASRLRNDCDFEIEVAREGEERAMIVTKQKDGPDGQEYPFKLRSVYIYTDDRGVRVNSCVAEYPTEDAGVLSLRAKRDMNKNEINIYEALQEHYRVNQEWPDRDALIEHVEEVYGGRKSDIKRAVTTLTHKKLIVARGDCLTLPPAGGGISEDIFEKLD